MSSQTVFQEILQWSANQPSWLRDGLRRVVVTCEITLSDIDELVVICKEETLGISDPSQQSLPLENRHLPSINAADNSVTLISIGNLSSVNRLLNNQTIPFGESPGLTVIYGENGSGKSGYARVIKKACRTRGAEPVIKSNAFEPNYLDMAKADINFREGNTIQPTFLWEDGKDSLPALSNIFVFDANTAHHYLRQDDSTSFTPAGLDILPNLINVYDAVGKKIIGEITTIEATLAATRKNWIYEPQTNVATFLDSLNHESRLETLEQLADLSDHNLERIQTLKDSLSANPKIKSLETKASAKRIQSFVQTLKKIYDTLQEDKLIFLKKQIKKSDLAANQAKDFSQKSFADLLNGTGGREWKNLWEAAKQFSQTKAYPRKEFPVTDLAKCLLCQNDLNEAEQIRLKEFDAFVKDKSQDTAKTEKDNLDLLINEFRILEKPDTQLETIRADLQSLTREQKDILDSFVESSGKRLHAVHVVCNTLKWNSDIPKLTESPQTILLALIQTLENRAETEASADDPETRKKLIDEKRELEARVWIKQVKSDVEKQRRSCITLELLKACKLKNPKFISDQNKAMTQAVVTQTFCNRFKEESFRLGLCTLDVNLEEIKSPKGVTRFGLRLEKAKDAGVHEIASEGEQRCIALAAFLAELSQASHQSALVFDDPVSSLDHWHREKIAQRLVEESLIRQVIIFTHDTVFLNDLEAFAQQLCVTADFRFLEWNSGRPDTSKMACPGIANPRRIELTSWKSSRDRLQKTGTPARRSRINWKWQKPIASFGQPLKESLKRLFSVML